jgi:hypothetical protein
MRAHGVFAVHRGIWEHELFQNGAPYSRREAWIWLISEAAWKPHRRRLAGRTFDLQRGQLVASTRHLARSWRWSEAKVRRFLTCLKTDAGAGAMIDACSDAGVTVITIRNYCRYQRVSLPDEAGIDRVSDAPSDAEATQERRKEEDREYKEDSEANASGAAAPRDFRAELFRRGLAKLAAITGKGPDACRSFVGKCLKAAGDDAVVVLGLIEDAERNRVADPSAWIAARLKSTGPSGRPLTAFQQSRKNTQDILDDLGNYAAGSGGGGEAHSGLLLGDPGQRSESLCCGSGADAIDLPAFSDRARG